MGCDSVSGGMGILMLGIFSLSAALGDGGLPKAAGVSATGMLVS